MISAICPTYYRHPNSYLLLEEAIQSFLQQDYPDKELIILNDAPNQKLICDLPQVRVLNWRYRFSSLGGKYNMLCSLSLGEFICCWEDDDLSLPHRLSQSMEHIQDYDYFNPQQLFYWHYPNPPLRDHGGVCHNASCFRKDAWLKILYDEVSGNQDALFDSKLKQNCKVAPPLRPDEKPAYIYRWGVSNHLSGHRETEKAYNDIVTPPSGEFVLIPHFVEETQSVINKL